MHWLNPNNGPMDGISYGDLNKTVKLNLLINLIDPIKKLLRLCKVCMISQKMSIMSLLLTRK